MHGAPGSTMPDRGRNRPPRTRIRGTALTAVLAVTLALSGCSSDATGTEGTAVADESGTTARVTTSPSTTVAATTTTAAPTTVAPSTTAPTTTTIGETALEQLGYPVSGDYVVETIMRDIDSGTGGLAVDADGVFYQADFGYPGHDGNAVYRIDGDGTVETLATSDDMRSLTATRLGPDGILYQSSYGSGRVFAIDAAGDVAVVAEGIDGPTGIVVEADGSLLVESYDDDVIHRVLPDGSITEWVTDPEFNGVNGLDAGPDGTIYAVNHRDGCLFAITPDGTVTLLHEFPEPTSHVVYSNESLFVTSRGAYVVFRYDLGADEVEIIAGNGEAGDQDGRGSDASFGRPNAIAIGPDGALYTNHGDGDSNSPVSIRRITYEP